MEGSLTHPRPSGPYFLFLLILSPSLMFLISCQNITIYRQSVTLYRESVTNTTASTIQLETNPCTNLNYQHPEADTFSCQTEQDQEECIRLYEEPNCQGTSVEVQIMSGHKLTRGIKSLGPCVTTSVSHHPNHCLNPLDDHSPFSVDLYQFPDSKGRSIHLNLREGSCYILPRFLKRTLASLRLHTNYNKETSSTCLTLYEGSSNCSTSASTKTASIHPPQGQETLINLGKFGFHDNHEFKSLSLCDCPENEITTEPLRVIRVQDDQNNNHSPTPKRCPHLTFYDEPDFQGNEYHVVLKNECVPLPGDWEGGAESLVMYKTECGVLYKSRDCQHYFGNDSQVISWKRIMGQSETKTSEGFNLEEFGLEGEVRSLGPCPPDEDVVNMKRSWKRHLLSAIYLISALLLFGVGTVGCAKLVREKSRREEEKMLGISTS